LTNAYNAQGKVTGNAADR